MKPIPTLSLALTILFIALKLCGVIHWSWLWVISPEPIRWTVLILSTWAARKCQDIIWKNGSAFDRLKLRAEGYKPRD